MGGLTRKPYRVGVVQDWGIGRQPTLDWYHAIRMAFDEALEANRIDRPVEVELREIEGMPYAQFDDVRRLWREVVAAGCIAVIGPHFSFATLGLVDEIDRVGVPTLMNSASMAVAGRFSFLIPNGGFADEATIMARYLADRGASKVAVVRDTNALGDEYFTYFRVALERLALPLASDQLLDTFGGAEEISARFSAARDSGADGLAYMGYGGSGLVLRTFRELRWSPARVMSSIFLGTIPDLGYGFDDLSDFEGWAGIDQVDEENPVLKGMLDRFEARYGRRPFHAFTALGYDFGNALAEALAMARPADPAGLARALERVRMLPAAVGRPGTVISFAAYDHRAYKSGDYVLIREVRDGRLVPARPRSQPE